MNTQPPYALRSFAACMALAVTAALVPTAVQAQDAAEGRKKAAMCIGCHGIVGYQASFPEVHKVPMISGQNAKYIVAALAAYKKGDRKHPTMRGIAAQLSDKDMADLGAYYEANLAGAAAAVPDAAAAPAADLQALLTKGACVSCHGANFNKPIDGAYPKIAGQHADYLYVALTAYGREAATLGRNNAIMAAQTKNFSRAELKAMAKYIASLPGGLQTVPQGGLHQAAR